LFLGPAAKRRDDARSSGLNGDKLVQSEHRRGFQICGMELRSGRVQN
jgi:hypothetical protein